MSPNRRNTLTKPRKTQRLTLHKGAALVFAVAVFGSGAGLSAEASSRSTRMGEGFALTSQPATRRVATAPRVPASLSAHPRALAPVITVSSTGPSQEGYIHYFLITDPEGENEVQVGIELSGDRIAWSFPEVGVGVSPFISSGRVWANGRPYEVAHLYGIRPFPDDASMRVLQHELERRIAPWLEDKTPYCDEAEQAGRICVSCLGFVLRVLYPVPGFGLTAIPALPTDFESARRNTYTTEDLLMYLAGVRIEASRPTQMKRIESLAIPHAMREELVRIANANHAARMVAAKANGTKTAAPRPRPTARPTIDLPRPGASRRRS